MARPKRREIDASNDVDVIVQRILEKTDGKIVLALPLGLGKPNTILNALTRAACSDRSIKLDIFTALTLEIPQPKSELERRFIEPAKDRLFGKYPAPHYAELIRAGSLPSNITIKEFFLLAGRWLGVDLVQQNYISANYTHAFDFLVARNPNVVVQLLAKDAAGNLSLSCNTDITADLFKARNSGAADFFFAGEINSQLPFMPGVDADATTEVDLLYENPETEFELFSVVKRPVSLAEQAVGLHASTLVKDGGTLQIGIGSIGDAFAKALLVRHQDNETYNAICQNAPAPTSDLKQETGTFSTGLYAATEMLVDGLLQLFTAGIMKRDVDGAAIHAGFFVEARSFYETLRNLPLEARAKIKMMPVSFTNSLYGNEKSKRAARVNGRFVNNAMMATLLGHVISDGTHDGKVVSGVGGQFNFVTQAFALKDARSIITVGATRESRGKTVSNIVWNYAHTTIPRHLKDIVVTEYGIADLRGKSDFETVAAMLNIADSRFQPDLLDKAKRAGKLPDDYRIPEQFTSNTPERIAEWLGPFKRSGDLPEYPFGTDFSDVEQALIPALGRLKQASHSKRALCSLAWRGFRSTPDTDETACLQRMGLDSPRSIKDRVYALLLRGALKSI